MNDTKDGLASVISLKKGSGNFAQGIVINLILNYTS